MSKAYFFSQLILLGSVLTYSKLEPVSYGSTANPSALLIIISLVLFFTRYIPKICLEILQRASLYLPVSALFVYFYASNINFSFDFRFLLTSFAFFVYSIAFVGFGVFLSSLRINNFQLFFNICHGLLTSLIILLLFITPLNLLSLQCLFFKCRELSSSIGVSLINSEPSYVGIFLFSILTFSIFILNDSYLRRHSMVALEAKLLIFSSVVLLTFSKSPLALTSVAIYALLILSFQKILPLFKDYKFSIPTRFFPIQIFVILFLVIATIFALFYTKIGAELYSLIDASTYLPSYLSQSNPLQTLVFLGGNRISYLFSLLFVEPPLLFSGHSVFASSDIFEYSVNLFYENIMRVGFFSEFGAKPHSALGQLIFTFGIFGSLFIYYPVIRLFLRGLLTMASSNPSYLELWIIFSPIFSLLYFSPNTDPWKFCIIMIFVSFTYSYHQPPDTKSSTVSCS